MSLLVVEDRHAEHDLRRALEAARARGAAATVLTGDALLAMRLRREGIDARLAVDGLTRETVGGLTRSTVDARDRIALDGVASAFGVAARDYASALGTRYGPYLQYTLIPAFVRAVRNIVAVDELLADPGTSPSSTGPGGHRIVLVGGGPLVDAAQLVAARRNIPIETVGGDFLRRASQAYARLRAGRTTRWVASDFRALVLEPGFIWVLFLKGLWRQLTSPRPVPGRNALVVVGDRFTADVVGQLRGSDRQIVLAGATQPGRVLFDKTPASQPIESFTRPADALRWIASALEAIVAAIRLTGDEPHARRFVVPPETLAGRAAIPYWPLVGRTVWLHIPAWVPALRHLQTLAARTARACPGATLLTSSDVTAYNRVLIDTLRRVGVPSTGIQHGIVAHPNGHAAVHVDRLATWGTASERRYREWQPQQAQFVVTGNPRFDALAARVPSPESPVPHPFTITVCTGFVSDFSVAASDYENLLMLDAVLDWARRHPGAAVIHKMHPGEEPDNYASAARALGWDPLTLKTIREPILYDVLERSNVLVAAYSTTVLESIALGTPAIVLDAIARYGMLPLDAIRGVGIAMSRGDLDAQLTAHLAAHPVKAAASRSDPALVEYIGQLDGKATERVAALLMGAPATWLSRESERASLG
jgi:hypothetical protein